jgi:hypothetical protein
MSLDGYLKMSDDWFLPTEELKPVKGTRYTPPVPTTAMTRILESVEIVEECWAKNNLYASNIGCESWDLSAALDAFWAPQEKKKNIFSEIYMKQSSTKHEIIQEFWYSTGLLHPLHEGEKGFQEVKAKLPKLGISGKLDLILPDVKFLKDLGATKSKNIKRTGWAITDIKECSSRVYKNIHENLKQKYRGQLCCYHKWGVDNEVIEDEDDCYFYYMNRDNPRQFKMVSYAPEKWLMEKIEDRCKLFWEYVQERKHPNKEDYKEHCESQIEKQKDRDWNPLAEI